MKELNTLTMPLPAAGSNFLFDDLAARFASGPVSFQTLSRSPRSLDSHLDQKDQFDPIRRVEGIDPWRISCSSCERLSFY
jgi:hypothetical protein